MLKVTSESTSAEPALVEITSEEPVAYSRVLYDDGNLIVVGNLLEYPEEYLQMTRTVYELSLIHILTTAAPTVPSPISGVGSAAGRWRISWKRYGVLPPRASPR